jgi:uncharacterized membrane protein
MVARLFSIKPAITLRGRRFRGIRGWKGKPSHPPLTDFPIAYYLLAAACDVISFVAASNDPSGSVDPTARDFYAAATIALVAGAVVSLATATTGFWDWWKGVPRDRKSGPIGRAKHTQVWRTANWHMTVMLTVTAIVIVDLLVRLLRDAVAANLGVMILSVLAGALVAFGAAYGGALVFEYGFNVESAEGTTVWDETEADVYPGRTARPPSA